MTTRLTHAELRNAVMAHYLAQGTPAAPAHVAAVLNASEAAIALALSGGEVQGIETVRVGATWGFEPSKELLRQSLAAILRMSDTEA